MRKTYIDEIITYPVKALNLIKNDVHCVGLIANKAFEQVTEQDKANVAKNNLYSYQYVDNTVTETTAFVWAEVDIPSIENMRVKNMRLYITVACHKQYMDIGQRFSELSGNRRDNLIRYIDKLLNFSDIFGLGKLTLRSVKTINAPKGFTIKEIEYEVPEFNMRQIGKFITGSAPPSV